MSEAIGFFSGMLAEGLADLHTCMPCRVERFDEPTYTADVQPLPMRKYKERPAVALSMLSGVPILRRKVKEGDAIRLDKPFLEPGDIVLVAFCERSLDHASTGIPYDPGSRKFSLDDGIILGVLT